jgi:hypothetical protein
MKKALPTTVIFLTVLTLGGCWSTHADLLAMRKVILEIQEDTQIRIRDVHVYAMERGILLSGELVAIGVGNLEGARIFVTLRSPTGEILAETNSPALRGVEGRPGTSLRKKTFTIPVHTRASEGCTVQVSVNRRSHPESNQPTP